MTETKKEIPAYIKEMEKSGPVEDRSNFGPEDVEIPGGDGEPRIETLFAHLGSPNVVPLFLVVAGLVKGADPGADPAEIRRRTNVIVGKIRGRRKSDDRRIPDERLLERIAAAWVARVVLEDLEPDSVVLRAIVRRVIAEAEDVKSQSEESTIRRLERKFRERRDELASEVMVRGYQDRYRAKFADVEKSLAEFGVTVDCTVFDDL